MQSKTFLLFIIQAILLKLFNCDKLRFVFGLFRHGARAPWNSLDINNIDLFGSQWDGDSQLTAVGLRQHYLLGYKNRLKYFKNLNITSFNPNEISIFSTETDRTIMSAYSELFGMYQPGSGPKLTAEQLNNDLPPIKNFDFSKKKAELGDNAVGSSINPIPVHLFDKYAQYFHLYDSKLCPPVKDIQDANKKTEKFLNFSNTIIQNYGQRMIKLINKTDVSELKNYYHMYYIFDTFMSNYIDGRNMSKLNEVNLDIPEFYNLTVDFLTWDQYYINYGDKDNFVARMSFSPIFRNLFGIIDSRIALDNDQKNPDNYNPRNPKILLHSGHDTSLAAMYSFLKYFFGDRIQYEYTYFASSFYFELFKNETSNNMRDDPVNIDDTYYLNILYNEVNIFGGPIKYSELKAQIKDKLMTPEQIVSFCKFDSGYNDTQTLLLIILVVLILLSTILGYLIYNNYRKLPVEKPILLDNKLEV